MWISGRFAGDTSRRTADPRCHRGNRPSYELGSALALLDLLGRLREDGLEVADHTEVDELEDRRLLVLVDRDDRLGRLHAGAVLDRTGDAVGDVELRRHGLAGLADLERVRVPARVDRRTGRTHSRAEAVGERLDLGEV